MYDAVEIDFVIQQKHLSDAGYNVLAYDIRNHGTSSGQGVSQYQELIDLELLKMGGLHGR